MIRLSNIKLPLGYTDEELIKPGEDVNEIMDSPEVHM